MLLQPGHLSAGQLGSRRKGPHSSGEALACQVVPTWNLGAESEHMCS